MYIDKLVEYIPADSNYEELQEAREIARIIEIEMGIPNFLYLDYEAVEVGDLYKSQTNRFLIYCYAAFCLVSKNAAKHGQVTF